MEVIGGYQLPAESLFVGGCVRNTLLEKPVTDIDIATLHHPLKIIELLNNAGIRYIPTGLEHGTVTALLDDAVFEITTLRRDVETDGRHAVIAFTEKWLDDAHRRDFTINTLLASPDGMIFDPTGQGLQDLDSHRIVFVGAPEQRIAEDYLRILRFFRFHALYGQGVADPAALNACKTHAASISQLSRERVTQELFKILSVPNTAEILGLMFSCHVLPVFEKSYAGPVMERLCDMQQRQGLEDIITRLRALSPKDGPLDALILSNAQKAKLKSLGDCAVLLKRVSKKKMREAVYRYGNADAAQAYFLTLAQKDDFPDLELLDIARYWQAPVFPVSGDDLIARGILPGPQLGKKLQAIESKWVKSDFMKIPQF